MLQKYTLSPNKVHRFRYFNPKSDRKNGPDFRITRPVRSIPRGYVKIEATIYFPSSGEEKSVTADVSSKIIIYDGQKKSRRGQAYG